MKILHIYRDCLDPGGVPHLTRRLIGAQAAAGDEVLVVTARRKQPLTDGFGDSSRIRVLQVSTDPTSVKHIAGAIETFRPNITHVTGLSIGAQLVWMRAVARSRMPYIVSPYGQLNPLGMNVRFGDKPNAKHKILGKKVLRSIADRSLLRGAAAIHAESEFTEELALAAGAHRTFLLPIGIDEEWRNETVAVERRLHSTPTFLYLGRFDMYQKGLDLIVPAIQLTVNNGGSRHFRVILAGPSVGDSTAHLTREIQKRGLEEVVEIRDPIWEPSRKEALWREADFFFSVCRYGGMPRATAEAIGNGLPLVASRESNWGDWVAKETMGAVAELNIGSVARAIASLRTVTDRQYIRMSHSAFRFAKNHSYERIARALRMKYVDLVDRTTSGERAKKATGERRK